MMERGYELPHDEAANLARSYWGYEHHVVNSTQAFFRSMVLTGTRRDVAEFINNMQVQIVRDFAPTPEVAPGDGRLVFKRNPAIKGTMGAFGYDYFTDHYGEERERSVRLLRFQGLWGSGGEYAYEVLNIADGNHNAQQIRDAVSAIYGPIPLELVLEYLKALESINVVQLTSKL